MTNSYLLCYSGFMTHQEKFESLKQMIETGASEDEQLMMLTGYTKPQLTAAFELVSDKNDWKRPVFGYITREEIPLVMSAVKFFTATSPEFSDLGGYPESELSIMRLTNRFRPNQKVIMVKSPGYRSGPAGDH